jgi:MoxR-like ATPase
MSHVTVNNNVTHEQINQISEQIKTHSEPFRRLLGEVGRVIVGQEQLMHRMLVGLLGNGHLLIEGVPGLAKTTAVSCLAKGINTGFQRLQFTPDLLPADLIGTLIYRPQDQDFVVQKGPIFFKSDFGGRNQSRACKSTERSFGSDARKTGHDWW